MLLLLENQRLKEENERLRSLTQSPAPASPPTITTPVTTPAPTNAPITSTTTDTPLDAPTESKSDAPTRVPTDEPPKNSAVKPAIDYKNEIKLLRKKLAAISELVSIDR